MGRFSSRRFLLAALSCASATWLQYIGKLDPAGSTFALVMVGTVGAYITGGTAEKLGAQKNGGAR